MPSTLPGSPSRRSAAALVNNTTELPAGLSAAPNRAMPTTCTRWGRLDEHGGGVADREPCRVGAGLVDDDLVIGLRRPPGDQVEGVERVDGGPVGADGRGAQVRVAHRLALLVDQLGVAADGALGGPDAGDGGDGGDQGGVDSGTLATELGEVARPRTWASVPALRLAKRSVTVLPMVSVSTSVPATKATPSSTARAVVNRRRLAASRPLRWS